MEEYVPSGNAVKTTDVAESEAASPVGEVKGRATSHKRRSADALLKAAQHMFISKGFHATTVESIAESCGLTKGAVYFHFRDKRELLIALLDRIDDQIYTPLLKKSLTGTQSPPHKLLSYLYKISAVGGADIESVVLPVVISVEFNDTGGDPIE